MSLPLMFLLSFLVALALELASVKWISLPAGTLLLVYGTGLLSWTVVNYWRIFTSKARVLVLIPMGFALGDLAYALSNYILKLSFANRFGALTYLIPYFTAMGVAVLALSYLLRSAARISRFIPAFAIALWLLVFALNFQLIVVPALFHKTPPLSDFYKALTILFTVLEAAIVGFSACLLIFSSSGLVQTFLFGLLIMHVSDFAIRYQSVDLKLMEMGFFDYGWTVGLVLLAASSVWAQRKGHKEGHIDKSYERFLPVYSLRAITVGVVFTAMSVFWVGTTLYYGTATNAYAVAQTLLLFSAIFCFSVLIANLLNSHLDHVLSQIGGQIPCVKMPWEIERISASFKKLSNALATERDHVLKLSSRVAHDIRSPNATIKAAVHGLKRMDGTSSEIELLETASDMIERLSAGLLDERKKLLRMETLKDAAENAVKVCKANYPDKRISLHLADMVPDGAVSGFTDVLVNIISNACEASSPDMPIRVCGHRSGPTYTVIVEDRGRGIPEHVLESLRVGNSISTKSSGNGIGISSALEWTKDIGADFSIDSCVNGVGRGTKVAITLPC